MQSHTTGVSKISSSKDTIEVSIPNGTDFNNADNSTLQLADFEQYRITESTNIIPPVTIIALNGESISTQGYGNHH